MGDDLLKCQICDEKVIMGHSVMSVSHGRIENAGRGYFLFTPDKYRKVDYIHNECWSKVTSKKEVG